MYVKTNGYHKHMLHKSLYKFAPYLISLEEHVLYYSYKSNYNLNHNFFLCLFHILTVKRTIKSESARMIFGCKKCNCWFYYL